MKRKGIEKNQKQKWNGQWIAVSWWTVRACVLKLTVKKGYRIYWPKPMLYVIDEIEALASGMCSVCVWKLICFAMFSIWFHSICNNNNKKEEFTCLKNKIIFMFTSCLFLADENIDFFLSSKYVVNITRVRSFFFRILQLHCEIL